MQACNPSPWEAEAIGRKWGQPGQHRKLCLNKTNNSYPKSFPWVKMRWQVNCFACNFQYYNYQLWVFLSIQGYILINIWESVNLVDTVREVTNNMGLAVVTLQLNAVLIYTKPPLPQSSSRLVRTCRYWNWVLPQSLWCNCYCSPGWPGIHGSTPASTSSYCYWFY